MLIFIEQLARALQQQQQIGVVTFWSFLTNVQLMSNVVGVVAGEAGGAIHLPLNFELSEICRGI